MSVFDKMPSLMPVVIAPQVWESVIEFPDDPEQMEERLASLLLAVLLTLRTAGSQREKIMFSLYCLPPRGDMKAPVSVPLSLNRMSHYLHISLAAQA
ncbi:TPA: hypothetical protein MO340_000253 [Salmonella enterica subsp. salamae serovar 35:g,m,s,t:-]|nr:hypothetical protein [Salmonella enterica subsp. salamae serovar 35:g,m,s,t:-]HCA3418872.1 hypothetical protein [Salmonella enterica subsp. salamae serovar 35:g,m,s,t:-]HCA3428039.1 hypothetical protein [Salmonella enterica subsp. salamae serovar 35:g,m,s,t:-]HCA3437676.1 hypothetical protein [Salmonella enterica subsp. salamae serovar 35:g,m,s,t:-]HCA3442182.1 hypothetical protein [Salmonella enterica subsp. salamae serovar 35:g,m,s,t:-]